MYFSKAKIKVKASGYWYSSGGGKGSFGYFPHLKDREGYPVFPDTQLLGNIKFSIQWLLNLTGENSYLFNRYFKRDNNFLTQSKLLCTDLELTKESKKKWQNTRFKIMPRIKINEETNTVEEHFLVSFETSFLEGLELEASLFLGYISSKDDFLKLKQLITQSFELIGFAGAFRSRGFGKGKYSVLWEETEEIAFQNKNSSDLPDKSYKIVLKNLVNFRNKRIVSGKKQNVETANYIASHQFKSWLAKTFHNLFNQWLDYEVMEKITVSDIFPSEHEKLFYPSPLSFMRDENGNFADFYNNKKNDNNYDDDSQYLSKPKSLDDSYFVSEQVNIIKRDCSRKFRNVIDPEEFKTVDEGGLFTQEFIEKNNFFAGTIYFANDIPQNILSRLIFIIKNVRFTAGFSIFEQNLKKIEQKQQLLDNNVSLSIADIPYFNGCLNENNSIKLGYFTSYATMLKRPRRNKIAVMKKSILTSVPEKFKNFTVTKPEITKEFKNVRKDKTVAQHTSRQVMPKYAQIELSSAQAGLLRRIKDNFKINQEAAIKKLEELDKKFQQWGYYKPDAIDENIVKNLLNLKDSNEKFIEKIDFYLDSHYYTSFCKKWRENNETD